MSMEANGVRQLLVLGAAIADKEFRQTLKPGDFADARYSAILREMQDVDGGADRAQTLNQLPAFLNDLKVENGGGKIIDAIVAAVRLEGRWARMKHLAGQINFSMGRDEQRLDELKKLLEDV